MERNYKLYLHTTPNGKRYYGITKQNINLRWRNGKGYQDNPYFTNAINKYGWDNIKHEVLADGLTEYEAKELEQYMIQWYDTANRDYGYNITKGGEGTTGLKHTEETRQKMSENNVRYWKNKHLSDEHKQKISRNHADLSGKNNPTAKLVICITTRQMFYTIKEGADYYNTTTSGICRCCKGKLKSSGKHNGQKLVWRYLNHRHNKTYRIAK